MRNFKKPAKTLPNHNRQGKEKVSSPFIRRSSAIAVGAVALGALVSVPVAAFAADPANLGEISSDSLQVVTDPDGAGTLYTLTEDVRVFGTVNMPNDATLDGNGHTITAVEDSAHRNFPGPVLASFVGTNAAPAKLDIKNLDIVTEGFEGGSNSGGLLNGVYMYRAGGSLSNVSVTGISHGNGTQEGNAISIRNRVSGDDINVPRAQVTLTDIDVTHYQKTGLLLDGNLGFTVKNAHVGQAGGPQGQTIPGMSSNSVQISRGASGSVTDSEFALNNGSAGTSDGSAGTAVLLYNAKNVDFNKVNVKGGATAPDYGISVSNVSNTIDTAFTMRDSVVERPASGGTGLGVDGAVGSVSAKLIDTTFAGWTTETEGPVTRTITGTAPIVTKVDVKGTYHASRPAARKLRIDLTSFKLGANQVEAKMLVWTIKVDGRHAATIRQHAGDHDVWAQKFAQRTGTHTVEVVKNGVSMVTYKVQTR